ncbi:hypothetical protein N302_15378, partial [Corvus brachyrhynchos]
RLQRRQRSSGLWDHQEMSSVAFWCTSRQFFLISSKAGNLINKVRIYLSLCTFRINAVDTDWLGSPMAFLNKHHTTQFVLQHRFSSRLTAHTPRFIFPAKRLQALQK